MRPVERPTIALCSATSNPCSGRTTGISSQASRSVLSQPAQRDRLSGISKRWSLTLLRRSRRPMSRLETPTRTSHASSSPVSRRRDSLSSPAYQGSGKTQIALRFGDWLGEERTRLIPVRPDWTGSEALFGFEDALQPAKPDGRLVWHVPAALEFMLTAAADPHHPYLLILDEMNLAHVERYFADVLSGMESGASVLPNLLPEEDGRWRLVTEGDRRLPLPEKPLSWWGPSTWTKPPTCSRPRC